MAFRCATGVDGDAWGRYEKLTIRANAASFKRLALGLREKLSISGLLLIGWNGDQVVKTHLVLREFDNPAIPSRRDAFPLRHGLRNGRRGDFEVCSEFGLPTRNQPAPSFDIHAVRLADACLSVKHLLTYFLVVSRHG